MSHGKLMFARLDTDQPQHTSTARDVVECATGKVAVATGNHCGNGVRVTAYFLGQAAEFVLTADEARTLAAVLLEQSFRVDEAVAS